MTGRALMKTRANHPLGAGLDCYYLYQGGGIYWQMIRGEHATWRLVGIRGSGDDIKLAFEQEMDLEEARAYAAGYNLELEREQLKFGL